MPFFGDGTHSVVLSRLAPDLLMLSSSEGKTEKRAGPRADWPIFNLSFRHINGFFEVPL
jgi:hypothetical protein